MKKTVLNISSLHVEVEGKQILKGLDLNIKEGEVHILFGPNGSGKSTLLSTIMNLPGYDIKEGLIEFNAEKINGMKTDAIARGGIALSFQHPPAVHGVSLSKFLNKINNSKNLEDEIKKLDLTEFLNRDLNTGFSGGELKRAEILKLYAQNPQLVLIDEPESGVDLENIAIISKAINDIVDYDQSSNTKKKSALIITHTGYILDYIDADVGHMIIDGKIVSSDEPKKMMAQIRSNGFSGVMRQINKG
ncbi:MAG: ATP-binding cassette domain-containing protein [Sulfurimonas sp.]